MADVGFLEQELNGDLPDEIPRFSQKDLPPLSSDALFAPPPRLPTFEDPHLETAETASGATKRVRHALLSAGARRQAFDDKYGHRCLIPIRGKPLISHILLQLNAAGFEAVTFVVPPGDEDISKVVLAETKSLSLKVTLVEAGGGGQGFFALSLAAARDYVKDENLLIATVDHLFEASILEEFATKPVPDDSDGVVLVELDWEELIGLPGSAVHVRINGDRITALGSNLSLVHGLEGGLMVVRSEKFFSALSATIADHSREREAGSSGHFSLCDVLSHFVTAKRLGFRPTAGRMWIALETDKSLQACVNNDREVENKVLGDLLPWVTGDAAAPEGFSLFGGFLRKSKALIQGAGSVIMHVLVNDAPVKEANESDDLPMEISKVPSLPGRTLSSPRGPSTSKDFSDALSQHTSAGRSASDTHTPKAPPNTPSNSCNLGDLLSVLPSVKHLSMSFNMCEVSANGTMPLPSPRKGGAGCPRTFRLNCGLAAAMLIHVNKTEWRRVPAYGDEIMTFESMQRRLLSDKKMDDSKIEEYWQTCSAVDEEDIPKMETFWVDNTFLQAKTAGVGYRLSKDLNNRDSAEVAPWGCLIDGIDCGDGWLVVEHRFLPFAIRGAQVLFRKQGPCSPDVSPKADEEKPAEVDEETPAVKCARTLERSWSTCSTHHGEHDSNELSPDSVSGKLEPTTPDSVHAEPQLPQDAFSQKQLSVPSLERRHSHAASDHSHSEPHAPQAMRLHAAASRIGKPDAACEDAYFVGELAIGVADGVGGMTEYSSFGVDVAAYATEVMLLAEHALQNPDVTSKQAIAVAEAEATNFGASTMMVVRIVENYLDVAGLGDSGMWLLRTSTDEDGNKRLQLVARSREQQHGWNFPFQLHHLPENLLAEIAADCPKDSAENCLRYEFPVMAGDLVLAFTDGFSDNLFEEEIMEAINDVCLSGRQGVVEPNVIAKELTALAYKRSQDAEAGSPFSEGSQKHGHPRPGGKPDDITVVVAWVVDKEAAESCDCD